MSRTMKSRTITTLFLVFAIAGTASAESAARYVQDGLLACWDGVENAGTGVHDPSTTVWKDLSGNYAFTL